MLLVLLAVVVIAVVLGAAFVSLFGFPFSPSSLGHRRNATRRSPR
jgi:hypothetical protein